MVPDAVNLSNVRRVLVVKLRHHGDVLLTSPVFTVLRNHAPHAEVDALVYGETRDMLEGHPAISQIHAIDRDWKRQGLGLQAHRELALLQDLRERRYSLIVHLTDHWRGAWLAQALRPRYSVAPERASRWWRWSFSHRYPSPKARPRHTVESNLDALRRLGIYPEEGEKSLVMVPGEQAQARVDRMLADEGIAPKGFIQVHPASRWLFKTWTDAKNAAFLRALVADGHRVVVTGAPDAKEREILGRIVAQAAVPVTDFSGKLSLREMAALSARARLFFGVDSAPMHIAAAVGTPVVALFGPSGEHEWGPWRVPHRVVTSTTPAGPAATTAAAAAR